MPLGRVRPVRQIGKNMVWVAQRRVFERVIGQSLHLVGRAALLEKVRQHRCAFIGQHPAHHLRVVVDLRIAKDIEHRASRPRLGLGRAIDHGIDPRMQHGTAAHGTRLQRHVQGAAIEPVVAQTLGRSAQCQHLGMGGGVLPRQRCIAALAHHLPVFDDHRAHGHFA